MMFGRHVKQKMSQYLVDQIGSTPNIEVLTHTQVTEVGGVPPVERIGPRNLATGEETECPAQAIFILVGAVPHSACVTDLVAVDDHGFILTGDDIYVDGKRPQTWTVERGPHPITGSSPDA